MKYKKCLHIDIDGTIFFHHGCIADISEQPAQILNDVQRRFKEWQEAGHYIILETARPEELREKTENDLRSFNLYYDRLIMGLPNYPRVLINDTKPYLKEDINTAEGIMIQRNTGLGNVHI